MPKNLRNSKLLYLIECIVGPPATPTTDITNYRRGVSSPGGEETGEGGQLYANGAIFNSIEEICRAPSAA